LSALGEKEPGSVGISCFVPEDADKALAESAAVSERE
jgi:hypothetical protein